MIIESIRPVDVEITTIFTLTELKHLHFVLSNAIIRNDSFSDKTPLNTYYEFFESIKALVKETDDDAS